MFPQVVSTKKSDGRTYRYLHIVESYREGKSVKKRRVASLGNIDMYSEKEIEQIILKLQSFLQERVLGSLDDFELQSIQKFGIQYVFNFLWNQLKMTEAIQECLRGREVTFDVARYVKAMVLNRLLDPTSKLHLFRTIEDLYLPDFVGQDWELQHFYRALDYLTDIKEPLEKMIYNRLTDLLNSRLSLVFYDLTSAHVTGHHCSIAKRGYSRTHRPDLEQVELGLLVTPEGLPLCHEVFAGNVPDKQTVPDILEKLKEQYAVEQYVFVGDRGMVTNDNLTLLAEMGYPYIVGYHKRGRVVSDQLLAAYPDVNSSVQLHDNLMYLEVDSKILPTDGEKDKDVRYILCYNPIKAIQDAAFRQAALQEAEEDLHAFAERLVKPGKRGRKPDPKNTIVKVAEILTKKNMQAYFDVHYDGQTLTFTRNEGALAKEALRDGKFLVKTNTKLSSADVVTGYKTLIQVERAFREIKNFLEIRPIYHWNEKRVRGHIFVCVLAYLFEQELQVLYRRSWEKEKFSAQQIQDPEERSAQEHELELHRYSGQRILEELGRWSVIKADFIQKPFYSVPKPSKAVTRILNSLEIPIPKNIFYD